MTVDRGSLGNPSQKRPQRRHRGGAQKSKMITELQYSLGTEGGGGPCGTEEHRQNTTEGFGKALHKKEEGVKGNTAGEPKVWTGSCAQGTLSKKSLSGKIN